MAASESSCAKSKNKSLFPKWLQRAESNIISFRNLDESDVPGFRSTSVTYTGFRHRTKDVLLSFMFKDEIRRWMEQAEVDEKVLESRCNKVSGLRKRLTHSTDDEFTE